ncbi:MAG: hypothetical protein MJ188_10450 [Treponema sp.]|nr:hypothetical protein [Treponema sp.]
MNIRESAEMYLETILILSALLERIGVPKEIATEDACKIEHDISATTFECIKKSIEGNKHLQ